MVHMVQVKTAHGFAWVTNHKEARCGQGDNCTGPGCRLSTGKTARDRARKTRLIAP